MRRASIAALAIVVVIGVVVYAVDPLVPGRCSSSLRWRFRIGAPAADETSPPPVVADDPAITARLAVAGDVGTSDGEAAATAAVMDAFEQSRPYDALLLLGDNVYPDGDAALIGERVLDPFAAVLDGPTALVPVLGNHDVEHGHGPAQVEALGMPDRWYERRIGNVLVIALDSNDADDPDQLRWLAATLAGTRPAWTIVTMHHPAVSAGCHGDEPDVVEHFVPLFEEHSVDLVLAGHEHDYQRSVELEGVTYVISGAAATLRPTGRDDRTATAWSTRSFVDLVVFDDRIAGRAIDRDGRAIDTFVIGR